MNQVRTFLKAAEQLILVTCLQKAVLRTEYKILIRPIPKSKAKLFRMKTSKFLVGEKYEIAFEFENIGEQDFPGGICTVSVKYTNLQKVTIIVQIPKIEKEGKKVKVENEMGSTEKIETEALSKDFALFTGEIKADDGNPVTIFDNSKQKRSKDEAFDSIFVETRSDVHTYYVLIISAVALVMLVILSLAQIFMMSQ